MPVHPAPRAERGRVGGWLRRRAPLLVVSGVLSVALVFQARGRVVADTKLDLLIDPGQFLSRALDLWDPTASFGRLQNQAVGYWFPMGPFFWIGERLGAPVWLVQRLWWAAIVLAALWGLVKLAEALEIGTPASRLLGAIAFASGPGVLIELGTRSPNVVPLALLPFALLPLVYGSRGGSPRRAAAASALVVLAMGGINAAVTGAALLVPLLFLLTRTPGRRRRSLTVWWIGAVAAATAWWWGPLLLQQRYGFAFTEYTENAAATTSFMSLTEIVRGTGFWLARLVDGGNPWLPAGIRLATDNVAIVGTCALAAAGLAGLAHRRLPERTFLVLCVVLGVAGMGAAFGGELGGPFAPQVKDLLDGPLVVIRNIHKLGPLVALPLALGVVHSVGLAQGALVRASLPRGSRPALAVVSAAAALLVVVAAAQPIVSGEVAQEGAYEEIPGYWRDAATFLNERTEGQRTLVVPASTFSTYRWGSLTDEPLQSLSESPWAVRDIIPFGGTRSARLMDGFEELFEDGRTPEGWAESLARSGVGYVVVRNDLELGRTASPDPAFVSGVLARAPGLERVAGFGPPVEQELTRERITAGLGSGGPPQSLEVYEVETDGRRVTAYDLPSSLAVLGSSDSVQLLADQGVLEGRGTILAADDPELAEQAGWWVITDDLRRRDVAFGLIQDAESYTLIPGEQGPDSQLEAVDRLLPGDEDSQSHVEYLGPAREVRASSYYRGFAREPGSQPYAALDGDPTTAWHIAGFREAEGEWWQVRFEEPQEIPAVTITLPEVMPGAGRITEVRVHTDEGSVRASFPDDEGADEDTSQLRVELPEGPTEDLRIRILDAERTVADLLPVGIAEVELEGIEPVERVVVTPAAPTSDPAAVVLAREPSDPFETVSTTEDMVLDRLVDLPATATYDLRGTAVGVPGEPLDDLVAELRPTAPDAPEVRATSALEGLPALDSAQAVDGDPATSWVADISDAFPAIALRWDEPRTIDGIRLQLPGPPALQAEDAIVTVAGEDQTLPIGADGVVDLGGIVTDELRIALDVADLDGRVFGLVGLSELEVLPAAPGAAGTSVDPAEVPVELPCGSGPDVVLEGEQISSSVTGTLEQLERLEPLAMTVCATASLSAGEQRVTGPVTGALQVQSLVMEPQPPLPPAGDREVEVLSWSTEQREVRVGVGSTAALLTLAENENAGWEATLHGEALDATTVDGWRQAWVLPADADGVVTLSFRPGGLYDRMLQVGLLLVLLAIGATLWPDRGAGATGAATPARSVADVVVVGLGTAALALAAGPVALLVPFVWIVVRRAWARPALAVVAFVAIALLMGLDRVMFSPELAAPGQLLGGLGLAAAIVGPSIWPRPPTASGKPSDVWAHPHRPDEAEGRGQEDEPEGRASTRRWGRGPRRRPTPRPED